MIVILVFPCFPNKEASINDVNQSTRIRYNKLQLTRRDYAFSFTHPSLHLYHHYTYTMSNINTQVPIDPVAEAGATAQTSGFVQPSEPLPSTSAVAPSAAAVAPAANSSTTTASPVAPASAILGSAGIPAQFGYMGGAFGVTNYANNSGGLQSSPNVPAPGSSIDHSTGKPFSAGMTRAELEAKNAADLSGREQAARQLAGPGLGSSAVPAETPLKELPGGWGRESSASKD